MALGFFDVLNDMDCTRLLFLFVTLPDYFFLCTKGRIKEVISAVKADTKLLPQIVTARDEEENTMLHWAALGGKGEVVKYLIDNGCYYVS